MKPIYKLLILSAFLSSSVYGQTSLLWSYSAGGGINSSPSADSSILYIGSNDSCLYALDKLNGNLKWKFKTEGEIKSKPLLYKGSVIFNSTDGLVYSIDKRDASEHWTLNTHGEKRHDIWDYYLSSPVYSDNKIFIGSGDGNIYAIDPDSGTLIWKFQTGGIVHATPLIHNKIVYVGSFDGFFYAINSENGELVWKFRTVGDAYFPLGEIQKGATLYKNSIIFGSRDFNIYSLDAETGRGLWNMKEKGSWIIATPLIVGDVVYFGTSDTHRFCGLNAKNGYEKCSYALNMRVYGTAVVFENNIYFGCFNGKLYKLESSKGKIEQVFQTYGSKKNYHLVYNDNDDFQTNFELYGKDIKGSEKAILELGAILSTPLVDDKGIVYFADTNGVIYAYKLK